MPARTTLRIAALASALPLAGASAAVPDTLPGQAASALDIAPVLVRLAPKAGAGALRITNHSLHETAVQLRVYGWDQDEAGEDRLSEDNAVVASPGIARIAPGRTQLFRLLRRGAAPARERTYRVLVDELPRAEPAATPRVQLRFSIPLIDAPAGGAPQVSVTSADTTIRLSNTGTGFARWSRPQLVTANGGTIALSSGAAPVYLLAGRRRTLSIAAPCVPQGARLTGGSRDGLADVPVPATCR